MGSQLQQVLRSLCFNTGWKYAVFWKLKHRARMMFTWEDAYYDSNQYPNKKLFNETVGNFNDGSYSHDPLGLALAKMSYQVFSLGEGIVGQVAVSGKHSWIYSDKHVAESSSMSEYFGGWQNQFSAGIKTVAVVAVIPYGVVQLGSLHQIAEDLKLVDHIRNVFSELQDSLAGCIHSSLQRTAENSCVSDTCTRISDSAGFPDHITKLDSAFLEDRMSLWSELFSSVGKSGNHFPSFPLSGDLLNQTLKMKMHERAECSMPGNAISLPSSSDSFLTRRQKGEEMDSSNGAKCGEESNDFRDSGNGAEIVSLPSVQNIWTDKSNSNDATLLADDPQLVTSNHGAEIVSLPSVQNIWTDKSNSNNATLLADDPQLVTSNLPLEILDSLTFQDRGEFRVPEIPSEQSHQDFEKNLELQIKSNCFETHLSPYSFCAGFELYEALGPFPKQNDCVWEAEKTCSDMAIEISKGIGSSGLLMENPDIHLLDAVVAKVSNKEDDTKCTKSCRDTEESLTSFEKTPCTSVGTISSAGYSFDRAASSSLNSVTRGAESLKGLLSPSSSRGSGHLERPREPVKMNKKRTRTGENCRPRPRDRQLIQDRIKELRELVPSGSKCSIDSLLERTIKHMLFLQSITKHAEKLHKCSASKLLDKDMDIRRFSCEQGSSWAVEVGNNPKVCPIIVENINMNGQMLVEMLCEECSQFLDIAETVRSLGLTILKGVSEAYGNKTWMCFVVENNRSLRRMDVLWSLMQLLQSKISN